MRKKHKILIVGQTPPPYGGQAIMIAKILNFQFGDIQFIHVRMNFSLEMNDIGKLQSKKIFELFRVIACIYWKRVVHNVKVLYYPPAGPNTVPILRDILILGSTRYLFRKTIFHFHAGGLSTKYPALNSILKFFFRKAFYRPDLTIRLSKLNPDDGIFLRTKKDIVVPYGIEPSPDIADDTIRRMDSKVNILYTGILKQSKGISVLIEAIHFIVERGHTNFYVSLMGKFESKQYELEIKQMIVDYELEQYVQLVGVKTGNEKMQFFKHCDIFCFPTYFESETFGIVLLEAMQFAKPVVATNWRGIPDIVKDGENGLLVDPRNPTKLADALIKLLDNKELRIRLGEHGLNRFLDRFTMDCFRLNFYSAIKECVE